MFHYYTDKNLNYEELKKSIVFLDSIFCNQSNYVEGINSIIQLEQIDSTVIENYIKKGVSKILLTENQLIGLDSNYLKNLFILKININKLNLKNLITSKSLIYNEINIVEYFSGLFIENFGDNSALDIDSIIQLKMKIPELSIYVETNKLILKTIFQLIVNGIHLVFNDSINLEELSGILVNLLDFKKSNGLIPTIVQNLDKKILMQVYSSPESLQNAIDKQKGIYFSRSRNKIWEKGETSGNKQKLIKIKFDCDLDSLIFIVNQSGNACHLEKLSCFDENEDFSFQYLYNLINERKKTLLPTNSYTNKLLNDNKLLLDKIKEESDEVINFEDKSNLIWEIADLSYFLLVLMVKNDISISDIALELKKRNFKRK